MICSLGLVYLHSFTRRRTFLRKESTDSPGSCFKVRSLYRDNLKLLLGATYSSNFFQGPEKYSSHKFLNFLSAWGTSDEDQSMRGVGRPAISAMFVFAVVCDAMRSAQLKRGSAPAWCLNSLENPDEVISRPLLTPCCDSGPWNQDS
ncbi:uncharacterized protein LOC144663147 [Oculina patagonica]